MGVTKECELCIQNITYIEQQQSGPRTEAGCPQENPYNRKLPSLLGMWNKKSSRWKWRERCQCLRWKREWGLMAQSVTPPCLSGKTTSSQFFWDYPCCSSLLLFLNPWWGTSRGRLRISRWRKTCQSLYRENSCNRSSAYGEPASEELTTTDNDTVQSSLVQ